MAANTGKRRITKKGSRKRPAKKSGPVPEKQWEMPAGFCSDGLTQATLREVVDPDQPTLQLSDLTLEQRAELVTKRLELQKEINLAMIGAGMIDKARAITEVKNKTKVGRLLIEIEHQMIRNLIEQSQNASAATGSDSRRNAPATTKSQDSTAAATKSLSKTASTTKSHRRATATTKTRGSTAAATKSRSEAAATRSRSKTATPSKSPRKPAASTKSRPRTKG